MGGEPTHVAIFGSLAINIDSATRIRLQKEVIINMFKLLVCLKLYLNSI